VSEYQMSFFLGWFVPRATYLNLVPFRKTGFVEDLANFDICFALVKSVLQHGVVAIEEETKEFAGVCFLSPYEEAYPHTRAVDPIAVLPAYQSK